MEVRLVKDIRVGGDGSFPSFLTESNGSLFFIAKIDSTRQGIWRSDGTEENTQLVTELSGVSGLSGGSRNTVDDLIGINDTLFLSYNDLDGDDEREVEIRQELWRSDANSGGVQLVRDIRPEGDSSNPREFIEANGTLFFIVSGGNGSELWSSDGTSEGTRFLTVISSVQQLQPTSVNGQLIFQTDDQLWRSDGTPEGTVLVREFDEISGTSAFDFETIDNNVFFTADDGENGTGLWRSDGTPEGTTQVSSLPPDSEDEFIPEQLTNVNGVLYFTSEQGLWKSDGTAEGTELVVDSEFITGTEPEKLVNVNGTLFFFNVSTSHQLWRSDGTEEGTQIVQTLPDEINEIDSASNIDGTLIFNVSISGGSQIWKSDGSSEGTVLASNTLFEDFEEFVEVDGQLFFSASDVTIGESNSRGNELWTIESDANNTPDNVPDSDSIENPLTGSGNTVYRFFNNNSGVHFYTANETERDAVQELDNFSFEGASYVGVDPLTGQPEPLPVYRFLNQDTGVHLYTISETERDVVQELDNFSFEGEAFFAYESEIEGSIPIYRFFNNTSGAHFYTPSAGERDNVADNLPEFQSEGIAYYALPLPE